MVADRIDAIFNFLRKEGLDEQFHPSYTRMAPAHYITEVSLVGCPDPNPVYHRYFNPVVNSLKPEIAQIGMLYIKTLYDEIVKWLGRFDKSEPVGVCFSGGIDSGSVFVLTYHALLQLGMSPARLKAFTLAVDCGGEDLEQAHQFLDSLNLAFFLETIEIPQNDIDWREAIRIIEDYKPLDIQSAAMNLEICKGIRRRYPEWRYLLDGDGGDENLKDYIIEENPELTINSVLNNQMLYQEGWGVGSIKHSLTYSGGLSRSYTRTYAPHKAFDFDGFSPYTIPAVIEIAEAIPLFTDLTERRHDKLYHLKGEIVSAGVKMIAGMDIPVYPKRRFQLGAVKREVFDSKFPVNPHEYRKYFNEIYA